MKISDVDELVQLLNEEFIDRIGIDPFDFFPFELESTGSYIGILYCGYRLWGNDCDDRVYDEDKDAYEPLRDFVLRESRRIYGFIQQSLPPIVSP